MINAIQSTEAINFLNGMTGKYFIPNDFSLLMGLLHTGILLVFYLPVKLKFNAMQVVKDSTVAANQNPLSRVWSVLSDNLGTFMVTASPLLSSLLQSIFSNIK
jgi:hypothetical protein